MPEGVFWEKGAGYRARLSSVLSLQWPFGRLTIPNWRVFSVPVLVTLLLFFYCF